MFYIRFFKQPRILPKSQQEGTISALVTITSDLGESFLLQDSSIVARAWSIDGTTIIARGKFLWTRGSRSLKIDIDVDVRTFGARPVVLQVSGSDSMGPDKLLEKHSDIISSVWSAPFYIANNRTTLADCVERRLDIGGESYVGIWEESRESIARHIWDGGYALTIYLASVLSSRLYRSLPALDEHLLSGKHLSVIELGSGCGIVGIALAQLRRDCRVMLTDLPVAEEIIRKNLRGLEKKQIGFRVLDWDTKIPRDILLQHFDIVVIADCMYNVDAVPALVSVIAELTRGSRDVILVLAHKKRHESESQFFIALEDIGMTQTGHTVMDLGQSDLGIGEGVDLYTMKSSATTEQTS